MTDEARRRRCPLRALALVLLGAALAAGLAAAALLLGGERLIYRALGGDGLARACRPPLVAALRDRGFEPADLEFGPNPKLGSPFSRPRTFGVAFTFRDGAAQVRVDGVVACVVAGEEATVEVRVSAPPRRAAERRVGPDHPISASASAQSPGDSGTTSPVAVQTRAARISRPG